MSATMVAAAAVIGYLLGSIPVGYLVVRAMRGVDVRTVGSGRTGGTNAMRAGGLGAGVITAIGDMLKGLAAVAIVRLLSGGVPEIEAIAGLGAVAGHNWSLFMGFKGGAGTSPNIGACMVFWPLSALWLVPMVPLGVFVVGYASVTSLVIAAVIPITFALRAAAGLTSWVYVWYGIVAALLVVLALRPNIKRLLNGTEPRAPRIGQRPPDRQPDE